MGRSSTGTVPFVAQRRSAVSCVRSTGLPSAAPGLTASIPSMSHVRTALAVNLQKHVTWMRRPMCATMYTPSWLVLCTSQSCLSSAATAFGLLLIRNALLCVRCLQMCSRVYTTRAGPMRHTRRPRPRHRSGNITAWCRMSPRWSLAQLQNPWGHHWLIC